MAHPYRDPLCWHCAYRVMKAPSILCMPCQDDLRKRVEIDLERELNRVLQSEPVLVAQPG